MILVENIKSDLIAMETPLIRYNLKERGRQHRGQERNFNVRAICDAINGGECQERVKNRDLLGFYGHWPRIKFSMNPSEGRLEAGKPVFVEPALVTTFLKASYDGTIEHKAEFLGTDSGKVAAKLFASRTGGFSSAIDQAKPEFHGFDYVFEPNFTTNRGYALDDVNGMTFDDVDTEIYNEQMHGMIMLLDSANLERDQANSVIERLRFENDELMDAIIKAGIKQPVMDSVFSKPLLNDNNILRRIKNDADTFKNMTRLPSFYSAKQPLSDSIVDGLLMKYGV